MRMREKTGEEGKNYLGSSVVQRRVPRERDVVAADRDGGGLRGRAGRREHRLELRPVITELCISTRFP